MTAYATPADYRARNASTAADDGLAAEAIDAASRYLDRRLGWRPGALGPLPDETLTLWPAEPSRVLRLRDESGLAWPLRAVTAVTADYTGSGRGTSWDPDEEPWIVPVPSTPPHRSLRIRETHPRAPRGVWPSDPGSVTVTGSPGRAAVPPAVRELVIHTAREILDGHSGGAAAVYAALEAGVPTDGRTAALWRIIAREYSAGRPGRLGAPVSAAATSRR